jgi:putative ABC transport system ATP-binding protein
MTRPLLLEMRGVTKILGEGAAEVCAVRNVSFALRGGELTMLMGPSGSGKTTLLSLLGCMLRPSSGTVHVCGMSTGTADAEALAKLRRDHIGFVFQSYHLFPTLTAIENVRLALDLRGESGRQAKVKSLNALDRMGLAHKASSFPLQLSGGEQQRVAIARAIVSNPSAILADEPTAALDGHNGQMIMGILADIAKETARGVLVVTHDSRLVPFADRILNMQDGRMIGDRGSAAVAKTPVNAFSEP